MNAMSVLGKVVEALKSAKLEAILVGNAAASLNGAPVMTADVDFMIRASSQTHAKLKQFALHLGAMSVSQPAYPLSKHYTILIPGSGVAVDLMTHVKGVKSFESLRSRSHTSSKIPGLRYADLLDIYKSKMACGRPKDLAVLPILKGTIDEKRFLEKASPKK